MIHGKMEAGGERDNLARERPARRGPGALCACALFLAFAGMAIAGRSCAGEQLPAPAGDAESQGETPDKPGQDDPFASAAGLESDPEIDTMLARAGDFAAAQRFDLAVRLLQKVLDSDSPALVDTGGGVYVPARVRALELVAALPPAGLSVYRLAADAEVDAILASPRDWLKPDKLGQVVRRFLLANDGDEAALQLSGLLLDGRRWQAAGRLLRELLVRCPRSSVDPAHIWLRLAVVDAGRGEIDAARAALAKAQAAGGRHSPTMEAVRAMLAERSRSPQPVVVTAPALEARGLGVVWDLALPMAVSTRGPVAMPLRGPVQFPVQLQQVRLGVVGLQVVRAGAADGGKQRSEAARLRKRLRKRWRQYGWFPSGHVLVRDGRCYVNCDPALVCVDLASGGIRWRTQTPKRKNDSGRRRRVVFRGSNSTSRQEQFAFRNRLARAMAMHAGVVYRIEKHLAARINSWVVRNRDRAWGNRLAAYEAATGKHLWSLGRDPDTKAEFHAVRFLAAPVSAGDSLLVPVEKSDGLYVYALAPRSGQVIWQRFVCAYQASHQPPPARTGLLVAGGEVYVASGQGVVMAMDSANGEVFWAAKYVRRNAPNPQTGRRVVIVNGRRVIESNQEGWADNYLATAGRTLVVMPTDSNVFLGLDRDSGRRVYERKKGKVRYLLGRARPGLVAGANDEVCCFDPAAGKRVWSRKLKGISGLGTLAGGRLLLPVGRELLLLDPATGNDISRLRVGRLRVGTEPDILLGNLYVQEGTILALGGDSLLALRDRREYLRKLTGVIAAGKVPAPLVRRARFYLMTGETKKAVADLRRALELASAGETAREVMDLRSRMRELQKLLARADDIRSLPGSEVFKDDFERGQPGKDWVADECEARIDKGALAVRSKRKNRDLIVRYAEAVKCDFKVEFDGWQSQGRLCDLSLMLFFKQPGGKETSVDVAFGAHLNSHNMLTLGRRRLQETRQYLMQRNKKHHLAVVKVGNRVLMSADDKVIIDYQGKALDPLRDSPVQIALYGWGEEHFFDNFRLTRIDPEAVAALLAARRSRQDRLAALQTRLDDLRKRGYVSPDQIKGLLCDALLAEAREHPDQALALVREARTLSAGANRVRVLLAEAEARAAGGDLRGAIDCYLELGARQGDNLVMLPGLEYEHQVAGRELAAARLERLAGEHGARVENILFGKIQDRCKRLRAGADATAADFWRLYRLQPHALQALPVVEEALRRAAADPERGLALQEAMLQAMENDANPRLAARALERLAELYTGRGWPLVAAAVWQRLRHSHPRVVLDTPGGGKPAGEVAKASLVRLRDAIEKQRREARQLVPPFKLLWRTTGVGRLFARGNQQAPERCGDFWLRHALGIDYRRHKLFCLDVLTGKRIWERLQNINNFNFGNRLMQPVTPSHMIFLRGRDGVRACDATTGKRLWLARGLFSQLFIGGGLVLNMRNAQGEFQLQCRDRVTGQELWRREFPGYGNVVVASGRVVVMLRAQVAFGAGVGARSKGGCLLLAGRTGETVARLPLLPGGFVVNGGRLVCRVNGGIAAYSLRDGSRLWRLPEGSPAALGGLCPLGRDDVFALAGNGTIALRRLEDGKELWRTRVGQSSVGRFKRSMVFKPVDNPQTGELVLQCYSNPALVFLDFASGRINGRVRLPQNWKSGVGRRVSWVADLGVSLTHVPVMVMERGKRGNRFTLKRSTCFLRRRDGKLLMGATLPRPRDLPRAGQARQWFYVLTRVGRVLVVIGNNRVLAYVHDDIPGPAGPGAEKSDLQDGKVKPEGGKQ